MEVTLFVLGSIPVKNSIEDNTLTVHFVIGNKKYLVDNMNTAQMLQKFAEGAQSAGEGL